MRIIIMPSERPYPVGYAAHSGGDDYAVSGDGATWPTGQVSMNTALVGGGVENTNMVFDWTANVWLLGSGGFVRSTDAAGTSWTTWPGPGVGGFGTLSIMVYDFVADRLLALDTTGVVAYAPTYTGPWTSIGSFGALYQRIDVGYVGGNTIVAFGNSTATRYTLTGGSSWGSVGGATSDSASGLCYNAFTNSWFNWEAAGQINESTDITVPLSFVTTGNTLSTGNAGGLICNPDTGVMIAVDSVASRSYWRSSDGGSTWPFFNTAGTGLPLSTIRSMIYDRSTSRWLLGLGNGRVYASVDDGLTWSVQNGGAIINDGANFFSSVDNLGYAQRYLQPHIKP